MRHLAQTADRREIDVRVAYEGTDCLLTGAAHFRDRLFSERKHLRACGFFFSRLH